MRGSKAGKFSDKVGRRRNSHFSDSESDEYASSHRTKFRRKDMEPNRRGSKLDGRGSRGNRDNFLDDDFDGRLRGARGGIKSRGPRVDEFSGRRNARRLDGSRNYKSPGPRADEFGGRRNDRRSDGSRNYKSPGPRADEFNGRRNDRRSDGSRNYNSPRPQADEFGGWRNDRRSDGSRNYKSPGSGKFENNQRGRFNTHKDDRGGDSDDFGNRRRVIER
ncbi:putative carbonic anhydrase 2 [Rhodamnia argentea]|uniref:Carbonic anhydrase 2 n=1 Tax=Rhodamnia argentea TaxID=178133 RepID=A0ABM3HJ75_9MYRT|nr:putative carbonic anhydrase 2 [Rhodamnia argentea]